MNSGLNKKFLPLFLIHKNCCTCSPSYKYPCPANKIFCPKIRTLSKYKSEPTIFLIKEKKIINQSAERKKDLSFVVDSLLVHVDVFSKQEILIAEKALIRQSGWVFTGEQIFFSFYRKAGEHNLKQRRRYELGGDSGDGL